jgi:hypothetical protein
LSRAELELEAQSLEPGQSVRMVCPFCGGGNSREKSLSLTHREDGTLLFNCYRAHCSAAGVLGMPTGLVRTRLVPKPSRTKPNIEDRLVVLPDGVTQWGMDSLLLTQYGVLWDPVTFRYALPVWSPRYNLRGRVLRAVPGYNDQPKALSWMYESGASLAWFGNRALTTVVVVEDIPSAMRLASHGERAVALNGTHMTDESIEELDENATDVVWALDPDATSKAMRWSMATRMYFRRSVVLMIDKDFKDMTEEEVDRWLSEISWPRSSEVGQPTKEWAL